jgi:hypothetical protein
MNEERCDLLCLGVPRDEAIRKGLLGVDAAGEALRSLRAHRLIPSRRISGVAVKEGREGCCTAPVVTGENCEDECCR